MAVALDADSIVGFLDRSDALHEAAGEEVGKAAATDSLVASAVTFAEVLTAARLGHHDEGIVRGFFADLIAAVIPVDEEVAEVAAQLRAGSKLGMADALVLATAIVQPEVVAVIPVDEEVAKAAGRDVSIQLLVGR